jgi:hypothetical protein
MLESEPSVSPKKPKAVTKASKLLSSHITFNFLGDNKKLQSVLRDSVPNPPSMTYQLKEELDKLIYDWEFGETLVVNECFIPLQYWRALYKDYFPAAWRVIKGYWSQWRVGAFTL